MSLATTGGTSGSSNQLLAALSPTDYQRLAPHLTHVHIEWKQVLYNKGAPVTKVYFPDGGVYSITTLDEAGRMVECLAVGSEGMVGVECLMRKGATAFGETLLQIPDSDRHVPASDAKVANVEVLRTVIADGGKLADLLGRFLQIAVGEMMQSVSCIALHTVRERCCRWLLSTHDRVQADEFLLTQEFLGTMLGIRRQSVAVVAGTLQKAGFIRYRHGRMTIVNREGLEAGACECYWVLRRQRTALLET